MIKLTKSKETTMKLIDFVHALKAFERFTDEVKPCDENLHMFLAHRKLVARFYLELSKKDKYIVIALETPIVEEILHCIEVEDMA